MSQGFWKKLNKPFFILAPMADVTDFAFRQMFAKYGKPDVLYTEFVSCDGLMSKGKEALIKDLRFNDNERPIIAQFFGAKPENFYGCAKLAKELGFDGFDINMGCPDKSVEKQGAGAALIKNPKLARQIIRAAKEGAGEMPVSVKTRIGYNTNIAKEWISELLAEKPAAIIIHGRTRKELSEADAHWDVIKEIAEMAKGSGVLIIGNGDVKSYEEGLKLAKETGVDGIMIGRGAFGNPWFFNTDKKDISLEEKFNVMLEHTRLFEKEMRSVKNFNVMKKHFKAYVSGFNGAKELRAELMEMHNSEEIEQKVKDFIAGRQGV